MCSQLSVYICKHMIVLVLIIRQAKSSSCRYHQVILGVAVVLVCMNLQAQISSVYHQERKNDNVSLQDKDCLCVNAST
jgi:ABC-type uncharacterized transport system permease subunit